MIFIFNLVSEIIWKMNIHLIAIGGSAMHNLALALHHKGYKITGSDDAIFSPSKERLLKYNLLPKKMGWFPEKITKNLDSIILGMHARIDNPELAKAKELNIPIYSYPEYIYEQSKNKRRIVIGGSHGKTSITAMILHVLQNLNIDCDYMVGAQLEGFDTMVKLTHNAHIPIKKGLPRRNSKSSRSNFWKSSKQDAKRGDIGNTSTMYAKAFFENFNFDDKIFLH